MSPRAYCSPLRTEAAEQTRQRLIEAAAALLRTKGPNACSLEAVAKAAGVTRLTVYKRFGSRRALLEAVFDQIATEGGIHRLREAMADPDPVAGLRRLISFFCAFWDANSQPIAGLASMGNGDRELEESVRERNERRRTALSALVKRMVAARKVKQRAAKDLVDFLFVLTGYAFYLELTRGRSKETAQKLIQNAAEDALKRAGLKP